MPPPPTVSKTELFSGFLTLGLLGFGGIAPWARYIIVERRRWLSEPDYAAFVGMGQILPGSNTVNASVLIGHRFQGAAGAIVSVVALMTMPLIVLVALALLYERFAALTDVRTALAGASAAAAGMVIGTAIKMARRLRPGPLAMLAGAASFVAAGILQLPLLPTVAVLIPLTMAAQLLRRRP